MAANASLCVLVTKAGFFPAGVSFALKQNMYWDGFCAFLPDISGLWGGGGGPNPARISKFGGGGGGRYDGINGTI